MVCAQCLANHVADVASGLPGCGRLALDHQHVARAIGADTLVPMPRGMDERRGARALRRRAQVPHAVGLDRPTSAIAETGPSIATVFDSAQTALTRTRHCLFSETFTPGNDECARPQWMRERKSGTSLALVTCRSSTQSEPMPASEDPQ